MSKIIIIIALFSHLSFTDAAEARRIARQAGGLPIEAICGANPVICDDDWCCFEGQSCVKVSNSDAPVACLDPLLTGTDGYAMPFF